MADRTARRVFSKEELVKLRSLPGCREMPAGLRSVTWITGAELVSQRWDLRMLPDGSLKAGVDLSALRSSPPTGDVANSNSSFADRMGQRKFGNPLVKRNLSPPSGPEGIPSHTAEKAPALVPLDESWLKPTPGLDHILSVSLEGDSKDPRNHSSHIDRILNERLEPEGEASKDDQTRPLPRRREMTRSPPPGFGDVVPADAGSLISATTFVRFAKGPSTLGFTKRKAWAQGERPPPSPEITSAPSYALPRVPAGVRPSGVREGEPIWKNDIDRMFAPGGGDEAEASPGIVSQKASLEVRIEAWSPFNGHADTVSSSIETAGRNEVEVAHSRLLGGWFENEDTKEKEKDDELAPNVLSFFDAVKAQAVIGAGAKAEVPVDRAIQGQAETDRGVSESVAIRARVDPPHPPPELRDPLWRENGPMHFPPSLPPREKFAEPSFAGPRLLGDELMHARPPHPPRPPYPAAHLGSPPPIDAMGDPSIQPQSFTADEFFQFFQGADQAVSHGGPGNEPHRPPPHGLHGHGYDPGFDPSVMDVRMQGATYPLGPPPPSGPFIPPPEFRQGHAQQSMPFLQGSPPGPISSYMPGPPSRGLPPAPLEHWIRSERRPPPG